MKHCPQCEFTFDDQEQVCDFDGTDLIPVPETPPSFKSISFASPSSRSFICRLVTSRAGLIVLAPVAVLLSSLLIGYIDSANQSKVEKSTSQTRDSASMVPSTSVDAIGQAQVQTDVQPNRPTTISTQRKIGPDELPPSMVKRLQAGTRSQSARTPRNSRDTKLVATKRRSSNSRLVASRRKPANATRQSQARNQARPGSRERARQQHTVASGAYRRQQPSEASGEYRRPGWSTNESAHHRKDLKVVAILKKTGSILKKPFDFIVDR